MISNFYNTCLNSIFLLFSSGGIYISSTLLELSSGMGFGLKVLSDFLFPIDSPVASATL